MRNASVSHHPTDCHICNFESGWWGCLYHAPSLQLGYRFFYDSQIVVRTNEITGFVVITLLWNETFGSGKVAVNTVLCRA